MTILTRLRELSGKATPGPWFSGGSYVSTDLDKQPGYPPKDGCIASLYDGEYIENENKNDALLIAELRNNIDKLLDVVEAAKAFYENPGWYSTQAKIRIALTELERGEADG